MKIPIQRELDAGGGRVPVKRADVRLDDRYCDWVVLPTGQIKTIYFHVNVDPNPWLRIEWETHADGGGRRLAIKGAHLTDAAKRAGIERLHDMYVSEGRMGDWQLWLDWNDKAEAQHIETPFPEAYLPQAARAKRGAFNEAREWTPGRDPEKPKRDAEVKRDGRRAAET